jgi:hypothetical protein
MLGIGGVVERRMGVRAMEEGEIQPQMDADGRKEIWNRRERRFVDLFHRYLRERPMR